MVSIELKGIPELRAYMRGISKSATQGMSKGLARAALHVQGEVKLSIAGKRAEKQSVDTGRFLNSIGINTFGKTNAQVYTDLPYAKFLEYGTSKVPARRHFGNTKHREAKRVVAILDTEVVNKIKLVGKSFRTLFKKF